MEQSESPKKFIPTNEIIPQPTPDQARAEVLRAFLGAEVTTSTSEQSIVSPNISSTVQSIGTLSHESTSTMNGETRISPTETPSTPTEALQYALNAAGLTLAYRRHNAKRG